MFTNIFAIANKFVYILNVICTIDVAYQNGTEKLLLSTNSEDAGII